MNEERWLVSYADFITLLFAFFVVMFASSQVDERKVAVFASTFESYTKGNLQTPSQKRSQGPAPQAPPDAGAAAGALTMAELRPSKERLETLLVEEIAAAKIEISLQPRGLILSLKEAAFFAPGQDAISLEARPVMAKVAQALRQIPGQIRLEGHTDNTPIRSRKFPSNWQLSTARSIAVLKLLTQEFQFPADRLAVAGYGEYHPLESNQAEQGRSKNRRVDLVVLTQAAAALGPS